MKKEYQSPHTALYIMQTEKGIMLLGSGTVPEPGR